MPSDWTANVTLVDGANKKTTMKLVIGTLTSVDFSTEASGARDILDAFLVDLKAATRANVYDARLIAQDPGDWVDVGIPADPDVDVTDEAAIIVYTDNSFYPNAVGTLRLPAPENTVWVNDSRDQGLDVADPLIAAFVANWESGALFLSDGEHVDPTKGTGGIKEGFWRSRKGTLR